MASEIACDAPSGLSLYFQVRRASDNQIWNTNTAAFEAYQTANIANYGVAMAEQGTASGYYVGSFPAAITTPNDYNIVARRQVGGAKAETDPVVAEGDFHWNGSAQLPVSDLATSGQLGQAIPIPLARGVMVRNFGVYMVSVDGKTPLVSGVLSGQVARDGGAFGPLQSGAFTETGNGWYNLQALTSGDLLANTVKLHFTAVGVSGEQALPRAIFVPLQRSSGV